MEAHQRALAISEEIHNSIIICSDLRLLGFDYLFASDVEQAAAHFQRCVAACDQALAQSPLYEVFYYRAFALLALAVIGRDVPPERLYEPAYRKAIEVNAAAGVLQEQTHEVERLQQILRQKRLDTPDALAATKTVLDLLKHKDPKGFQNP
jgi:non-ribosomal peptide synthetase component E (peptide arylation enzyme)